MQVSWAIALQGLSSLFAFVAALLWLRAGMIKTPDKIDHIIFDYDRSETGGDEGGLKGPLADVVSGLALQGVWNSRAAVFAAMAAALQSAAILVP